MRVIKLAVFALFFVIGFESFSDASNVRANTMRVGQKVQTDNIKTSAVSTQDTVGRLSSGRGKYIITNVAGQNPSNPPSVGSDNLVDKFYAEIQKVQDSISEELQAHRQEIEELKSEIADKNAEIADLKNSLAEYENIKLAVNNM